MSPRLAALLLVVVNVAACLVFEARGRVPFTSDQAAVALMAEDIRLRGAHPVFYYGSEYAGTLEPHYLAVVFAIAGPSPLAFRVAMGLLVVLIVLAIWALTRAAFGDRAGLLGGLYLAVGPSFFLYKGLCSDGAYASLLLLSTLALLLTLHVEGRFREGRAPAYALLALGLILGLAWWVHSPAAFLGPVLVVSAAFGATRRWLAPWTVGRVLLGFGLGSAPWWARNIETDLASLRSAEMMPAMAGRLAGQALALVTDGWATMLGAYSAWSYERTFPGAPLLAVGVLAGGLAFGVFASARGRTPHARHGAATLTAAVASLSILCLAVSRTEFSEPRYLYAGYAGLAPLLGGAVDAVWRWRAARILAVAALAALNLGSETRAPRLKHNEARDSDFGDYDASRLTGALQARGIRSVYVSYFLAYKMTFVSNGGITASPLGVGPRGMSRIPFVRDAVGADPDAGFLLRGEDEDRFVHFLAAEGVTARREPLETYTLFTGVPPSVRSVVHSCKCIPTPFRLGEVTLLRSSGPDRIPTGGNATYRVVVRNASRWAISEHINPSYHWFRADGTLVIWDGDRTEFTVWPGAGSDREVEVKVRANVIPGPYRLVFDLVEDGAAWMGPATRRLPEIKVEVTEGP